MVHVFGELWIYGIFYWVAAVATVRCDSGRFVASDRDTACGLFNSTDVIKGRDRMISYAEILMALTVGYLIGAIFFK